MPKYIDRPKDITLKSLTTNFASGNKIEAGIEFKARAGKKIYAKHWLSSMVFGGERRDKGLERALRAFGLLPQGYMAIPTRDIRTDGYGNVPNGYVTSIISYLKTDLSGTQNRPGGKLNQRQRARERKRRAKFFVVPIGVKNNLSPGIYEYQVRFGGRAVRKVFEFQRVSYRATFPFFTIAADFAKVNLVQRFNERFEKLMRGDK
ncbi:MAG: hypothetical protein ACXVB1_00220 [Pseudobdellovibrionaceae bacterium]